MKKLRKSTKLVLVRVHDLGVSIAPPTRDAVHETAAEIAVQLTAEDSLSKLQEAMRKGKEGIMIGRKGRENFPLSDDKRILQAYIEHALLNTCFFKTSYPL